MKIEMTYGILTEKLDTTSQLIDECAPHEQVELLKECALLQSEIDKMMIYFYQQQRNINLKKQNIMSEKLDNIDEATQFIKSLYTTEKVKSTKTASSKEEKINGFLAKYSKSMTK